MSPRKTQLDNSPNIPAGQEEVASVRVSAARPALIRVLNEQLLLDHIRNNGPCSRAELARVSGLSKSTVSVAMANVERAGLVREAGHRRGARRRAPVPAWRAGRSDRGRGGTGDRAVPRCARQKTGVRTDRARR